MVVDQPIASLETAKALVDVPSPYAGKIEKLYAKIGETLKTGEPFVGYAGEETTEQQKEKKDTGTVVGKIQDSEAIITESATGITTKTNRKARVQASPSVRALARELQIDLTQIKATGPGGSITEKDVRGSAAQPLPEGYTSLNKARQAMAIAMTQAHQQIVPVTLCEDANINAWDEKQNFTIRLIRAINYACQQEPTLNSHFDGTGIAIKPFQEINIGLAVDAKNGLYVPVLKDAANKDDTQLREQINQFKEQAQTQSIRQEDLHGTTIMLSNFGSITGRYANPILIPPIVAIVGVGHTRETVVAVDQQVCIQKILPVTLTIDHRAITGGEACRFLKALIDQLEKKSAN